MTSLIDDLQTAQLWAKGRFKYDVEIVDALGVYINFDHRVAVTIMPAFTVDGKRWLATVTEWDETGGVHMEIPLSDGSFTQMTAAVTAWLDTWEEQERRLEEEMNAVSDSMLAHMEWEQDYYNRGAEEEMLGRPLFPNEY